MADFNFFVTVTATTEIYTLSLHDALPICRLLRRDDRRWRRRCRRGAAGRHPRPARQRATARRDHADLRRRGGRSEEHTSELQSQFHLVCRLLLEKKNLLQFITWIKLQSKF